jgi:hypothetical protein
MRVVFCMVPAIFVGLGLYLIHPAFGLIGGVCMFGLGWQVTRAHQERGESDND